MTLEDGETGEWTIEEGKSVADELGLGLGGDVDGTCPIDCFPAGTLVSTPSGPRSIETLEAGDRVHTGSHATTATVKRLDESKSTNLVELTIQGATLLSSTGHRFLTETRGWVPARELEVGDRLRSAGTRPLTIQAIGSQPQSRPIPIFTLTLDSPVSFRVGVVEAVVASDEMKFTRGIPVEAVPCWQ